MVDRLIIPVVEHGVVDIPPDTIFAGGKLELYPDVQGRDLLRVSLAKDAIRIQASGYIGVLPLNDRVAIDIATRVPVASLEQIVATSEQQAALSLPFERNFGTGGPQLDAFLPALVRRYCELVQQVTEEGLLRSYELGRDESALPRGRIHPLASALRTSLKQRPVAVYDYFSRTLDNPPNRCIVTGLQNLTRWLATAEGADPRLFGELAKAQDALGAISARQDERFDSYKLLLASQSVARSRPSFGDALEMAVFLCSGEGLRFRDTDGVTLSSILLRMDDVFEAYVRNVLRRRLAEPLTVLDGNLDPPVGGASTLFSQPGDDGKNTRATPDVLIRQDGQDACVLDVKYKPCEGKCDRADLNQLLAYTVAYECRAAILAYPAVEGQPTGLFLIGHVRDTNVFRAVIQLGNPNLDAEEKRFSDCIAEALA